MHLIHRPPQEKEDVTYERDVVKTLTEDLGEELHHSKAQLGEMKTEVESLNIQLEVSPVVERGVYHPLKIYSFWYS